MTLPHRFPCEIVDAVDGFRTGVRLTANGWWLRDGLAAPLTLLLEAAAQAAGLQARPGVGPATAELYLAGIENAHLDLAPGAGSTVGIRVALTGQLGRTRRIEVEFECDGARCGGATLLVAEMG